MKKVISSISVVLLAVSVFAGVPTDDKNKNKKADKKSQKEAISNMPVKKLSPEMKKKCSVKKEVKTKAK